MIRRNSIASLGVALSLACAAGCSRDELTGPPQLRLGRDECRACGMLINDDRCSSGMLIEVAGMREHVLFDDIGCMLEYERDHASGADESDAAVDLDSVTILQRSVHDYHTRAWVNADSAWFVRSDADALSTPMASGIVAFADRSAADAAIVQYRGDVLEYAQLRLIAKPLARPDSDRQP